MDTYSNTDLMSDTLSDTLAHTLNDKHIYIYINIYTLQAPTWIHTIYIQNTGDAYTKTLTLTPNHRNAHISVHTYRETHSHLEYHP